MIFNMNGGGSSLNLTVVGDTNRPTNPVENTVWINTATEIGETYLQPNEPQTAGLSAGTVWINTGSGYNESGLPNVTDNLLEVMESPYLKVCIGTVCLWSGTAWSSPDVEIYSGSNWRSEVLYLYRFGAYSSYGSFDRWLKGSTSASESTAPYVQSLATDLGTCLTLTAKGGANAENYFTDYLSAGIDVTKYNKMTVKYTGNTTSSTRKAGLATNMNSARYPQNDSVAATGNWTNSSVLQTMEIDISTASGVVYPFFSNGTYSSGGTVNIYEFSLSV